MLGPLLVDNPLFTEYLIKLMNDKANLAFKKDVMKAYNVRVEEYQKILN